MKEIDGKQYRINTETGEVTEMLTITIPYGSTVRTPEQQEQAKKRAEFLKRREGKAYYKRLVGKELGHFYWIFADNAFSDLTPQTVAKLVMLCTYLYYDDVFRKSIKTTIKKKDLQGILNVSKRLCMIFGMKLKSDTSLNVAAIYTFQIMQTYLEDSCEELKSQRLDIFKKHILTQSESCIEQLMLESINSLGTFLR